MTRFQTSITALALTGAVGFSGIVAPVAAGASEEGKRNTAIALGALAVGVLLSQQNHHNDYCDDGSYRRTDVYYNNSYQYDTGRNDYSRCDRDDSSYRRNDHSFRRDDRGSAREDSGFRRDNSSFRRDDYSSNRNYSGARGDNQRQSTWAGSHRGGR